MNDGSPAKRGRGRTELIIFGRRPVTEALETPDVEVDLVRVSGRAPAEFRRELRQMCRDRGVMLEECSSQMIGQWTREPRHDQGIGAAIRLKAVAEVEPFLESMTGQRARQPAHVFAFDNVTNPQNIGMIVRSAMASGTTALLWPTVGSPWIDGLIVKSSACTVFRCPIVRCSALDEALWQFKQRGFAIYGLSMTASIDLYQFDPPHRMVFVVGSETHGLSPEVEQTLDAGVRIPMGESVESLNVAIAASLACFELMRRRRA